MTHLPQALVPLVIAAVLGGPVQARASVEGSTSAWPEKMVVLEQLEALAPYRFIVRGNVTKGQVTGPAVVQVLVDHEGAVVRAVLRASCGNADLDEAALHGMREMRFKPYAGEGAPMPVTLVAPIHVPKNLGRAR